MCVNDNKFEIKFEKMINNYTNSIENNLAYSIMSIVSYFALEKGYRGESLIKMALAAIKNDLHLLDGCALINFRGKTWKK